MEHRQRQTEPGSDLPRLLTPKQVARALSVGTTTLSRWVAMGQAPRPIRLSGRSLRWLASDLTAWMARGTPRTAQDATEPRDEPLAASNAGRGCGGPSAGDRHSFTRSSTRRNP